MRVFVTGGTGVLGQPTVRLLVARGHTVTVLARNDSGTELVQELGASALIGDLFDANFLQDALRETDAVLHLATAIPKKASPSTKDWALNDRIRREGTQNLLTAVRDIPLQSFVIQSVAFFYGNTRGEWKREQDPLPKNTARNLRSAADMESAALTAYQACETPVVILRAASLYGPTAGRTRSMLESIRSRRMPILGSGEQYWHWLYVDDMARACVIAAENPAPGEIFNVADDWPFHARDGLNYIAAQLNAPAPFKMTVTLARVLTGESAAFLAQSARYRTDKIKKMLGWAPLYPTYREGMAEVFRQLGKR